MLPNWLMSPWLLAALVVAAFALRLIAIAVGPGLATPPAPGSDEMEYDQIAWNLAQGRGYRGPSPDVADPCHLTAYRTPTTTIAYAAVYALCGHRYGPVHVVNCALSALTVLVVYGIGVRCFNARTALSAAAIYALYPLSIYFNRTLLSETHGALLVAVLAWCSLHLTEKTGLRWSVFGGIALGLLLLCKPGYVFALPLLPLLGWWVFRYDLRCWVRAMTLICCMFAVLVPWVVRNRVELNAWIPFGTGGGQLLACGNNRIVVEDPALYGYSVMDNAVPEFALALHASNDEVRRDKVARNLAIDWLSGNREHWFYLARNKFVRLWTPAYHGSSRRMGGLAIGGIYGVILVLSCLSLWPITEQFVKERHPGLILHVLVTATVVCALIFHGQHRYRFPIDSICILFASATLVYVSENISRGSLRTASAIVAMFIWQRRVAVVAGVLIAILLAMASVADEERANRYRLFVCRAKLEQVAHAVARFQATEHRLPADLSELVPDYLPNLDSLHCPAHSLGWGEYQALKLVAVQAGHFGISYRLDLEARRPRVCEAACYHGTEVNSHEIPN